MLIAIVLFVVVPIVVVVVGNMIRIALLNYLIVGPMLGLAVGMCWASLFPQVQGDWTLTVPPIIISAVTMTGLMEYARTHDRIRPVVVGGQLVKARRRSGGYRAQAKRTLRTSYVAEVERV